MDPGPLRLREMTSADIPAGMRLKDLAGWNQTADDWQRFLERSPRGCFVAELDAHVRGTVATIPYGNRVAWIGMVLVDPAYRGRGIGTTLLETSIGYLDGLDLSALKLDATPLGRPLYEKLGFRSEYEIGRWILRRSPSGGTTPSPVEAGAPVRPELLERVCELDREVFGADRSFLLKSLHERAPDLTQVALTAGTLAGYALGRRGSFADHLGPWVATDAATAGALLDGFLARSSREVQVADCLTAHPVAGALLRSAGFSCVRPLLRMFRGSNRNPGRPELQCAILGPEFG